ncbi:hypothetical protein [Buttiauxella agrestis]|uniref:hypothetical protein n=1 Tax=Buttiauxella agrestis TaxID=82977 RepID=UPI003975C460
MLSWNGINISDIERTDELNYATIRFAVINLALSFAGAFLWINPMPYRHTLYEVFLMLFTNPPEALKIIGIMVGGALTRACLGSTNGFLRRIGDLSFCILMYYCIRPFIPVMPMIFGFEVPRAVIAILISLLGSHVIYTRVKFFLKKKTGIDISTMEKRMNG